MGENNEIFNEEVFKKYVKDNLVGKQISIAVEDLYKPENVFWRHGKCIGVIHRQVGIINPKEELVLIKIQDIRHIKLDKRYYGGQTGGGQ